MADNTGKKKSTGADDENQSDVLTSGTYRRRTEETVTVWPVNDDGTPGDIPEGWDYPLALNRGEPRRTDHIVRRASDDGPVDRDVRGVAASLSPGEALVEHPDGSYTVLPADARVHGMYLASRERA